jgi:hypothetical protein
VRPITLAFEALIMRQAAGQRARATVALRCLGDERARSSRDTPVPAILARPPITFGRAVRPSRHDAARQSERRVMAGSIRQSGG